MPIPLAIPIGMAAAGLFTQAYGGKKSGEAVREGEGIVQEQADDLTAWYDTEKNRDFLQTNVGRSVINRVLENIENQNKQVESTAKVTGASDAAVIAQKSKSQEQFGNVAKDLASFGTAREDRIEGRYRASYGDLMRQKLGLTQQKAQNAGNLVNVGGQLLGASGELFGLTGMGGSGQTGGIANKVLEEIGG